MKDSTITAIVSIVCITVLEIINLIIYHEDGYLFMGVITVIAGFSGLTVYKHIEKEKT